MEAIQTLIVDDVKEDVIARPSSPLDDLDMSLPQFVDGVLQIEGVETFTTNDDAIIEDESDPTSESAEEDENDKRDRKSGTTMDVDPILNKLFKQRESDEGIARDVTALVLNGEAIDWSKPKSTAKMICAEILDLQETLSELSSKLDSKTSFGRIMELLYSINDKRSKYKKALKARNSPVISDCYNSLMVDILEVVTCLHSQPLIQSDLKLWNRFMLDFVGYNLGRGQVLVPRNSRHIKQLKLLAKHHIKLILQRKAAVDAMALHFGGHTLQMPDGELDEDTFLEVLFSGIS